MQYIRFFKPPAPVREISLVTHRSMAKKRLIAVLKEAISDNLPPSIKKTNKKRVMDF
jgi:LysR family hydrogen peroxide-inducible transcriptional activator